MYLEFCGTGEHERYEAFGKQNFDLLIKNYIGEITNKKIKGKHTKSKSSKISNILPKVLQELQEKSPKLNEETVMNEIKKMTYPDEEDFDNEILLALK